MKSWCIMMAGVLIIVGHVHSVYAMTAPAHLHPPPDLLNRVGFDQKLGAQVSQSLQFREANGSNVTLGQLLGKRPAILVLGYYTCPNLCDTTFDGVAQAVTGTGLRLGKDMDVMLVSINPDETPIIADKRQHEIAARHLQADVMQWHFLTAADDAAKNLAALVGFRYYYDKRNQQYDHAAGMVLLSPDGHVTRYLFGVRFPPRTLRLSLVEAASGKIGSPVDKLLLLCCGYDPVNGQYSLVISKVMRVLGIGFVLLLILIIMLLHHRQRKSELKAP